MCLQWKDKPTYLLLILLVPWFTALFYGYCLWLSNNICALLCELVFVLLVISHSLPKVLAFSLSGYVSSAFVRLYARYCVLVSELGCKMKAKTGSKENNPDLQRRKPLCERNRGRSLSPLNTDTRQRSEQKNREWQNRKTAKNRGESSET